MKGLKVGAWGELFAQLWIRSSSRSNNKVRQLQAENRVSGITLPVSSLQVIESMAGQTAALNRTIDTIV